MARTTHSFNRRDISSRPRHPFSACTLCSSNLSLFVVRPFVSAEKLNAMTLWDGPSDPLICHSVLTVSHFVAKACRSLDNSSTGGRDNSSTGVRDDSSTSGRDNSSTVG
ncbi:unnamed protein product [Nippostrongylus brasiliensis]|uniref:Uncharacterized protein n=1 Tax=Nippostrongylus brasiliensis TaxID=27835 RepID=A0A0N4YMC1_NIPBR|nr:unnamed protein product [Nippostrongylus brasiliensis]